MQTYPLYLNGAFRATGEAIEIRNPATREVLGRMSSIDRSGVAEAIAVAHSAFLEWRRANAKIRGDFLNRIANELEKRREETARAITLENGKPLSQSQAEVNMSIDHLRWFAEEGKRAYGRIIPNQVDGKRHLVIKTPIGVVGAISPWNFPLVLAVRKVAPALAAGCTVLLKPARQTPICATIFAECVHAAEVPAGVFQLVAGQADEIGRELMENPLCRKISFTGSTAVGRALIHQAAEMVKPLSLELGGHAPVLVFDDAEVDRAVDGVLLAKFRNTGQSCIAANRILVQRGIYEKFLAKLVEKTREMKVGNGLDPEVQIGPLINEAALEKADAHVRDALGSGGRLLLGGHRMEGAPGYFFEPTILADVTSQSICMHEETFAPIAAVAAFDREEEGIERANASPFGLSAYAFTKDLNRTFRLMEKLEAGMIGINDGVPTATHAPFGGVKQSGWGRELGSEGLEAFLETKHASIGISSI